MMESQNINDSGIDFFAGLNLQETKPEAKKGGRKPKASKPKSDESPDEVKPKKTKATPVKLTDEEIEKKEKLLMTLQQYSSSPRLGPYLKKTFKPLLSSSKIPKMTISELEELVTRVRTVCNNKTNTVGQDKMIRFAMKTSETLVTGMSRGKLDVTGTTDMCFEDEEWLDMLEQIKIEYLSFPTMSLPVRFTFATMSMGYRVAMEKKKDQVVKENADLLAGPLPAPTENEKDHNVDVEIPDFTNPPKAKK